MYFYKHFTSKAFWCVFCMNLEWLFSCRNNYINYSQARVQEFVRGGEAQILKAIFFFSTFQGGGSSGTAPWTRA